MKAFYLYNSSVVYPRAFLVNQFQSNNTPCQQREKMNSTTAQNDAFTNHYKTINLKTKTLA